MGNQLFLIQIPKGDIEFRVGVIQGDSKGKAVQVLWADSEVPESVRMGSGYRKAEEDSLTYLVYAEPQKIREMISADPTQLFYLALKEFDFKPKNFDDIAQLLSFVEIPDAELTLAWKSSLAKLVLKEDVNVVGGKNPTVKSQLRRTKPPRDEQAKVYIEPEVNSAASAEEKIVIAGKAHDEKEAQPQPVADEEAGTAAELLTAEQLILKLIGKELTSSEHVVINGPTTPLLRALISFYQGTAVSVEDLEKLTLGLLGTAGELQNIDSSLLSGELLESPELCQVLLPSMFLNKKAVSFFSAENVNKWLASPEAAASLRSIHLEYSKLDKSTQLANISKIIVLIEALLASKNQHVQLEDLVWCLDILVAAENKAAEKIATSLIDFLSSELKKNPTHVLDVLPLHTLSRILSHTPFFASGGRTGFVAALGHHDVEKVIPPEWWVGFDWEALNRVSTGPLAPLLEGDALTTAVRQPVVDKYLSQVSSRSMLAEVLGASRLATDLVSPEQISMLFDRAAKNDKTLLSWIPEIRQQQKLQSAETANKNLQSEIDQLNSKLSAFPELIQKYETEIQQIRSKLDQLHGESSGISEREKQQIQIESLRSIAQVAASVEQVIPDEFVSVVHEKLINLLRRQAIEPTSLRGQVVSFDPVIHSCPGKRPNTGDQVLVGRSGYKWIDKDNEVVLLQALVATA